MLAAFILIVDDSAFDTAEHRFAASGHRGWAAPGEVLYIPGERVLITAPRALHGHGRMAATGTGSLALVVAQHTGVSAVVPIGPQLAAVVEWKCRTDQYAETVKRQQLRHQPVLEVTGHNFGPPVLVSTSDPSRDRDRIAAIVQALEVFPAANGSDRLEPTSDGVLRVSLRADVRSTTSELARAGRCLANFINAHCH